MSYESADTRLSDSLADLAQNDPELATVVTAWSKLPKAVRVGIVAMVNAASCTGSQGVAGSE